MARQSFKIEGLKELQEALSELPKATGNNVLRRVLIKAATPMEAQAEALAPVAKGDLQRGISVGTKLSKRQMAIHRREVGSMPRMTVGGFRSEPSKGVYVFMGPRAGAKSIAQEFGTAHHAPHPYMRPAWDANKSSSLDSIKDDLASEIEKARARAARRAARLLAKMK